MSGEIPGDGVLYGSSSGCKHLVTHETQAASGMTSRPVAEVCSPASVQSRWRRIRTSDVVAQERR